MPRPDNCLPRRLSHVIRPKVVSAGIHSGLRLLALYVVTLGLPDTAYGATFAVNSTSVTADAIAGDGRCDTGELSAQDEPECTLMAAIQEANAFAGADTITLPGGGSVAVPAFRLVLSAVYSSPDGPTALPSISSTITISAGDPSVAPPAMVAARVGDIGFRIFHVAPAGVLTLDGLNIIQRESHPNAARPFDGGVIFNSRGTVNVANSWLQGIAVRGGAIFNRQGRVNITRSIIDTSDAWGLSASEAGDGGGIFNDGGAVRIARSLIGTISRRNLARGGRGGGVFTRGGSLAISNTRIAFNRATGEGGGGIFNSGGAVTITNSSLLSNEGQGGGGGVFHASGTTTISNATIARNLAAAADAFGGGIFNASVTPVTLRNTILAQNLRDERAAVPFPADCANNIESLGNNLFGNQSDCEIGGAQTGDLLGVDPLFVTLGEPDLRSDSPAIDAGNPSIPGSGGNACATTDERGLPRPADGNRDNRPFCDIGAFEFAALPPFPGATLIVNELVSFEPLIPTFRALTTAEGCPAGFRGQFLFNARLTTVSRLGNLALGVGKLTNGNLLQTANDGPGGLGAVLTIPTVGLYADGLLGPGDFVDVPFVVCLRSADVFTLRVDVAGVERALLDP